MVRLKALLAALLLLAIGGPAAAETLAVVRQVADSGVLIDLDTIRVTGSVGRVRTIAFARAPQGGPPQFADTEQEYDCTQMRVRVRMVRLLDERGAVVSQINDEFGAWETFTSSSPNTTTWAAVCRGQFVSSMQRVASAAAFGARYQAAPVRSAQPTPAPAPTAARATERYYVLGNVAAGGAEVLDLSTRKRTGSVVEIGVITAGARPPASLSDSYWTESVEEYDCAGHRHRVKQVGFLNLNTTDFRDANTAYTPWAASQQKLEDLVCRDAAARDLRGVDDLAVLQREVAALMPRAPTLAAPAQAAPRPSASGPAYVYNDDANNSQSERLFDLSSRRRTGSVVSITDLRIALKPMSGGSDLIRWMEETNEFDCAGHRYRSRLDGVRSLDLKDRSPMGAPSFDEWSTAEPGSLARENEDLFCRDQRSPHHKNVADPRAFQRAYYAEKGEKEPASVDEIFDSMKYALRWHAYTDPAAGTAALWDNTTEKRQGTTVSFTELVLTRTPRRMNNQEFFWMESSSEMDCANHRMRQRFTTLLDRGRKTRTPIASPAFEAWTPTSQSRYIARLEANLCNDTPSDTFRLTADLDAFERSFLAGSAR